MMPQPTTNTNTGGGFWNAVDHLSGLGAFWWDKAHQNNAPTATVSVSGSQVSASASPGVILATVAVVVLVVVLVTRK